MRVTFLSDRRRSRLDPCRDDLGGQGENALKSQGISTTPLAMTRRQSLRLAGAGALGLALAAPALAQVENRDWTMVAMEDFPPYNYYAAQKFIGIDVDILFEAAHLLGVKIKIQPLPWPRAILTFEAGGADGIFQVSPSAYRFANWSMTGPMRLTRLCFAVKADDPRVTLAADDPLGRYDMTLMAGHTVGVVNGFIYDPRFDQATGFAREGSIDDTTSLRKLMLGRVSTVLGGDANLRFAAKQLGILDSIRILKPPLAIVPRYTGFGKDAAGVEKARLMQRAYAELTRSGRVDRILAAHGEL